jgi:hypothetical protein
VSTFGGGDQFSLLSTGSPIKTSILPTVDATDFVNDIFIASLYSIVHGCDAHINNKFLSEFTRDLAALVSIMSSSLGWRGQNERSFVKAFAIQTIKRAILSSYFFITYIGKAVDDNYADGTIENTAELINQNDHIAGWLYENLLAERCTIYCGNGVLIEYNIASDQFMYAAQPGLETSVIEILSLRALIDTTKDDYDIQNYDFYFYLKRLFAFLDGDSTNSFNGVKNVFH